MGVVDGAASFTAAVSKGGEITVRGTITGLESAAVPAGTSITGEAGARLEFAAGQDGLQLTTDNAVSKLAISVDPTKRAIFNDYSCATLGTITLTDLSVVGQVQIIADGSVVVGSVVATGVHIESADATRTYPRPISYGVDVVQSAFLVWNRQEDPSSEITVSLTDISAGTDAVPINGSGVMVSGASDGGGRLTGPIVSTGPIWINGGIEAGKPGSIACGVFIGYGANINEVRNLGPVTTYGVNDMVLDSWGQIETWVAEEAITSYGVSGVGFVNFGRLGHLQIKAPLTTYGDGARGFNSYTGFVNTAEFHSVSTHGNGAVGMQFSKPVGRLIVHGDVSTSGAQGQSLVKGVIKQLPAIGLSVLPGCELDEVIISGTLSSAGDGIAALQNDGGWIKAMRVGGIKATGAGSDAVVLTGGAVIPLTNTAVSSSSGAAIRADNASITSLLGVTASGAVIADASVTIGTNAQSVVDLASGFGNSLEFGDGSAPALAKQPFTAYPH